VVKTKEKFYANIAAAREQALASCDPHHAPGSSVSAIFEAVPQATVKEVVVPFRWAANVRSARAYKLEQAANIVSWTCAGHLEWGCASRLPSRAPGLPAKRKRAHPDPLGSRLN
jgi:hypothetical protein